MTPVELSMHRPLSIESAILSPSMSQERVRGSLGKPRMVRETVSAHNLSLRRRSTASLATT